MAAKTNFTAEHFKEILLNYSLGEFICSSPIVSGTVETNYIIKTTKLKIVFRYYENRSKESVMFETNLIKLLNDKNYPCPSTYSSKHGHCIGIFEDKPYVIFEFIEGDHIESPNENQRKELIKRVAELQIITKNYRPINKKYRLNYSIDLCKRLALEKTENINTFNSSEKLIDSRFRNNFIYMLC